MKSSRHERSYHEPLDVKRCHGNKPGLNPRNATPARPLTLTDAYISKRRCEHLHVFNFDSLTRRQDADSDHFKGDERWLSGSTRSFDSSEDFAGDRHHLCAEEIFWWSIESLGEADAFESRDDHGITNSMLIYRMFSLMRHRVALRALERW